MCDGRWGLAEEHQQLNVASIPARLSLGSAGSGIAHISHAECQETCALPRKGKLLNSWSIPKRFLHPKKTLFIFFPSLGNRLNLDSILLGFFACLFEWSFKRCFLNGTFCFIFLIAWFGFFYRRKMVTSLCSCHLLPFILFPFLTRLDSV